MGIKFLCPNGHKLHVKVFLSGKRAICPKCGARVVVPAENPALAVGEPAPAARQVGAAEQSAEIALEESLVDNALEAMATSDGAESVEAETKPTAPPSHPPAHPIDEAPGAVWYVRPAGGGQFGPASAEIMRNWLDEGRVGANSLVWRAGWTEWRSAAATFPQLGTQMPVPLTQPEGTTASAVGNGMPPLPVGQAVQSVAPTPATPIPPDVNPPSMPPLAQAARNRRRKKDLRLIASAILVAVSLILVIVLVLISRAQSDNSDPKLEEPPPGDEETLI